jgi:hypothetical protein
VSPSAAADAAGLMKQDNKAYVMQIDNAKWVDYTALVLGEVALTRGIRIK